MSIYLSIIIILLFSTIISIPNIPGESDNGILAHTTYSYCETCTHSIVKVIFDKQYLDKLYSSTCNIKRDFCFLDKAPNMNKIHFLQLLSIHTTRLTHSFSVFNKSDMVFIIIHLRLLCVQLCVCICIYLLLCLSVNVWE